MRIRLPDCENGLPPFAEIEGCAPTELLDRHPDGQLVALHVADSRKAPERSGVWDRNSGRLVWAPAEAVLIGWADAGKQVLILRRKYHRDPKHPRLAASPLQSEFTHVLERLSWPGRLPLGQCQVRFPTGWAHELAASSTISVAAITWLEQDCGGFILVRWYDDHTDRQLAGIGEFGDGYYVQPDLIRGPVFSPDGRVAVATCSLWSWWAPDGDPETPSPGGRFKVGHVAVMDASAMTFTEREVFADLAPGWLPPDEGAGPSEMMGSAEFVTDGSFSVRLPTGLVTELAL